MTSDNQQKPRVLSQQEAQSFRLFEKYRLEFELLLQAGVLNTPPSCKIEINIHNGQIQNVYIHTQTYRRDAKGDKSLAP